MGQKNEKGSSILELVFAISISFIIGATAQLSVRKVSARLKLKNTTKEILHSLDIYAELARKSERNVHVFFDLDKNQIRPSFEEKNLETPNILKEKKLGNDIKLEYAKFGNISSNFQELILRDTGNTTPGRLSLKNSFGQICEIIQSLRGVRRYECHY